MRADHVTLRVAGPAESEAVSAVLASAYPALLAADYEPGVLASVLASMTQANPVLLASGTYYVSSLGAEAFYARLGFRAVERKAIAMRHSVAFPSVIMVWTDTANMAPQ